MPVSRELAGILLQGDAIIGNPPGALGLIPEPKLDDPSKLKRSLRAAALTQLVDALSVARFLKLHLW
jgi:hypothetical protein